jgi:hypothetical protein
MRNGPLWPLLSLGRSEHHILDIRKRAGSPESAGCWTRSEAQKKADTEVGRYGVVETTNHSIRRGRTNGTHSLNRFVVALLADI